MRHITFLVLLFVFVHEYSCQNGFPKQFQATINITAISSVLPWNIGVQDLLYDYTNLRVRFDIQGWRFQQNETYMIKYKPEGAEADSPASHDYTMFNLNPDYPEHTKHDCWYRTNPMNDVGPFPMTWYGSGSKFTIQPWFPLPSDLINKGEEWIPEVQMNAVRYDSPEICNLRRPGFGQVPCLSYFEALDRPVKTIQARAGQGAYESDEYTTTIYQSFVNGIPSEAEHLFDTPKEWPAYCGNANTGFNVDPQRGFIVTPDGQDHLTIKLNTPPVHSLGDQVKIEFKLQPSWYYNGTRCAQFNTIIFNQENWQIPQKVDMSFVDYGCCNYAITATGGGYEWQYTTPSLVVYGCDGEAGHGCKGTYPC